MNRQGFTLTEIIAAIVIVGVLAAIAIPGFVKVQTKADKNQAIAYLRNIRTAEKMYYGKWRTYLALANSATIKNVLRVESKLPSYTFAAITGAGASTATTFSLVSTDSGGKTLTLNESGVWGGTNTPLPPVAD